MLVNNITRKLLELSDHISPLHMKVIVTGKLCKALAPLSRFKPSMHHFAQEHLVYSELPSLTHLSGRPPTTPSSASPIHVQGESVIFANWISSISMPCPRFSVRPNPIVSAMTQLTSHPLRLGG
jgi:hypothetical protein